ncbi:hypothetical protein Y032_0162g3438 [Ancylostoma ceylanicum]|uniref:Peptidase M1 membrane alanine aminopeptidase domain-containing protein n=1 Tax=Ancylostoma ceylanicum TaxID=53326 RepID=A0A016SXP6_9BILA|nr:hypothetical protein Y032_0162g3438 [Ancylostoma ceylanicum]
MRVSFALQAQWFGNLVTLNWWDDTWLNEGFTTYFEKTKLVDNADGDLELHKDLFVHGNDASMRKDSLAASRPLSSIVDIATEIPEAFDKISYGKGGSILAMMRDVVGEQNFRKAIINYLKKFSFKTASTEDMWKAFDETIDHVKGPTGAKLNMLDFGNQWSKQMGFPLVTIESFNSSAVKLTQERYMLYPSALPLKKYRSPIYRYKWDIPLWYEKKGKLHQVWLTRDEPLYLEVDQAVPINVNVDRRGYFRQNYDTAGWQKIIVQFKNDHEVYSGWTRHGVISDAFAAALIDRLDYLTLFELLSYLPKEKENAVWNLVRSELMGLTRFFVGTDKEYADLYVLKLLEKPYQKSLAQYISGEVTRNGVQMFRVVGNTEEHRDGHSKQMTEAPGSSDLSDPDFASSIIESYCELGSTNCSSIFQSLFEETVLNRCKGDEKSSRCVKYVHVYAPLRRCKITQILGW